MPAFVALRSPRLKADSSMSMAASTPDWESALSGELFTFICGDDDVVPCKSFQIHADLAAQVSAPLNSLINNGHMAESLSRSASLPEIDPQTFVQFSQWLYTGIYRPISKAAASAYQTSSFHPSCFCNRCGELEADHEGEWWPFCSSHCLERDNNGQESTWRYCIECKEIMYVSKGFKQLRCRKCDRTVSKPTTPSKRRLNTADLFGAFVYDVNGMHHQVFASKLNNLLPPVSRSNDVTCHAKLYTFAMAYMIDGLRDICLHMLHRDLVDLSLSAETIASVIDLVDFTYANTADDDRGVPGGELRYLVLSFMISRKKELAAFPEFEELLVQGGNFVLDFFRGTLGVAS